MILQRNEKDLTRSRRIGRWLWSAFAAQFGFIPRRLSTESSQNKEAPKLGATDLDSCINPYMPVYASDLNGS